MPTTVDLYFEALKQTLKPLDTRILVTLKESSATMTQLIERLASSSKSTLNLRCRELIKLGLVHTKFGPVKNSNLYLITEFGISYLGGLPRIAQGDFDTVKKTDLSGAITPKELLSMLQLWSKERWEPKITKTASYLPLGVSKLYQLAFDVTVGSEVDAQDLHDIQYYMAEFRQNLRQTEAIMDRVIGTPELWDHKKFATFLLSAGVKSETANSLAIKMAEVNRQSS